MNKPACIVPVRSDRCQRIDEYVEANPGVKWPKNQPTLMAVRRRREIVVYRPDQDKFRKPPKREAIIAFSERSGSRLRRSINNSFCDFEIFGTLTYPQDWSRDGRVIKKHWKAFVERLRRYGYFKKAHLVWFLEFQARGAPHFHFVATHYLDWADVARMWAEITGGDESACTRVEKLRTPSQAGAYAAKYAAKAEQKVVPGDYTHVGRWWGRVGCRPQEKTLPRWFRAYAERKGVEIRPMMVPKVAAGCSRGAVIRTRKAIKTNAKNVHMVDFDYGTCFYGSESEMTRVWAMLMKDAPDG